MAAPSVYAAMNAVAELAKNGIAKTNTDVMDDYKYRSIDDVLDRLAPLLAEHRFCVLPRVIEREAIERQDDTRRSLVHVSLRVAFNLTSVDDRSSHVVEAFGEALDPSDKATAKAMSAAYKSAMIQTLCIPYSGAEEPDQTSYKARSRKHVPEPVQGWDQWVKDIEDIIGLCESEHAVSLVQDRNRALLIALSRERSELFQQLGISFACRLEALRNRKCREPAGKRTAGTKRSEVGVDAKREKEDA